MSRTRRRANHLPRRTSPRATCTILAAGTALLLFAGLLVTLPRVAPYVLWLAAAGIVTLVCYGYDKAQARRAGSRVPEAVLHAEALAGGFLGGWMGMYLFRHKTLHSEFKLILLLSSLAHGTLWYLWLR